MAFKDLAESQHGNKLKAADLLKYWQANLTITSGEEITLSFLESVLTTRNCVMKHQILRDSWLKYERN